MSGVVPRVLACRAFSDRSIDRHVVDAILEAARWTGSARNRQPWHWTMCTSRADRHAVAACGYYAGFLTGAPLVAVLSTNRALGGSDTDFDAGRAAQQFLTAAHLSGLGACPATLDPAHAEHLATLLDVPSGWLPAWAIGVGHPAPPPALGPLAITTGRRPLDEVVTWRPAEQRETPGDVFVSDRRPRG